MKRLNASIWAAVVVAGLFLSSCDTANNSEKTSSGSGSESQSTPNDSSGAESRKEMGTGKDNQNDSLGYPSNQSNLNADSTSKKHDN